MMEEKTKTDLKEIREAIRRVNRRRAKRGQPLARYVLELDERLTYSNTMKDELEVIRNHRWIKCSEAMPDEHGTKQSKTVDITVEYEDGSRRTGTGKTYDGKWCTDMGLVEKGRVIAWRPRPEPYSGEE